MAFSALEKALALAVGIDLAVPGTNRKVVTAIAKQLPRVAPPVAAGAAGVGRAALGGAATLARRNPAVATGLGALALQRAGVFDPLQQAIEDEVNARVAATQQQIMAPIQLAQTDLAKTGAKSIAKRKITKYQRAVKAGMAAVKNSKFGGAKGKITNAKSTFATVNKVASAVNKGKKVTTKGLKGAAAKAIKGILRR
jgi:hypothetical protein